MKEVAEKSPEYLLKIVAHVVEILLVKLNVPREEVETFTEQIKEKHMGEFLANSKGMMYRRQGKKPGRKAEKKAG